MKKEILLIFPDDFNAQFIKCALGKTSHIVHVQSWTEAHYLLQEKHFDVILTEIIMVGMIDYVEAIASLAKESGCPVIVLTSQHLESQEEKCRKAGAQDFILLASGRATRLNALKEIIDGL